jgi:hypothetical protein
MEGNGYRWTGFLDLLQGGHSDGRNRGGVAFYCIFWRCGLDAAPGRTLHGLRIRSFVEVMYFQNVIVAITVRTFVAQ